MVKTISKKYQIPFDADGNQLHYPSGSAEWKENYAFTDTIRILGLQRGRSAAYYLADSVKTRKKFTIFMKDLLDIVQNGVISHGVVGGTWTFTKRGTNYGLAPLYK